MNYRTKIKDSWIDWVILLSLTSSTYSVEREETSLLSRLWLFLIEGLGVRFTFVSLPDDVVNEIAWFKTSCDDDRRSSTDFFLQWVNKHKQTQKNYSTCFLHHFILQRNLKTEAIWTWKKSCTIKFLNGRFPWMEGR